MPLGKGKQASILAVFLVFATSASGQTEKNYKFHLDGSMQKNDVTINNQSVTINYSISEINLENITNEDGTYFRVSIPGHIASTSPGEPELPVLSRLISIPEGSEYKIKIYDIKSTRINPSGKKIKGLLYPSQESQTKAVQQSKPRFIIDKAIYASRGLVSTDTVRIESLGTLRTNKLANLYISPVRYNPHSNTLEVITSMRIEITFSNSVVVSAKSIASQSPLFNQTLDKGIVNFNPGQVIPGYSDQPVKMIILTDSTFKKQLAPFIQWKTQKGFRVKVLYKGTGLAGNDYTQIKQTLTGIYNSSSVTNPPPEYLLIIGDVNKVPYYGTGGTGNITDMYYGEFDGNDDYIPEMYIGRIPVSDTTELKTVVKKIIQYEKFQFADTNKFYSRAIVTAGYEAAYAKNMNGQIKYATSNYLTASNKLQEYHFYYPQSYTSKDSLVLLINKGVSFLNYTGHGDALGWLHVNLKTPDIQSFNNKNMYPFVISNACSTAQFNLATSFGNKMLLTEDKGAIGFIGCSNDSYWDEDYYWAVGPKTVSADPPYDSASLGAYDRLFHTHGESPSDWYFTMGQINYAGNLAVSASNSPRKKYYWETYNLVGDPSIIPIMGKPGTFNITLPDTLPNGIKSLALNTDPFAYVAISHFDSLWDASYASNSGSVRLNLPGKSNDSCLVVITGQNKVPIMKTIYFSKIKKEFINLTASSINDSRGNNNGIADYGESIYLKLILSNLGLSDAHNLYAKISSSSGWLVFTSDSVSIGTLAANSEIILSDKLGLTISDNVPDMGIITLNLLLKDETSEKHYSIDIAVHSPQLQIISCVLDDQITGNGDNVPDPGETFHLVFKVRNQGTSNISGEFSVSSSNSDFSIIDQNVKSGTLNFGKVTDIPVLVKLSESIPSGSEISLSTILDCSPYTVNKDFKFRVGKIRESFEASSFKVFPWINSSPIPWVITSATSFDGLVSAKSGTISHSGSTSLSMRTIFASDDSLRFYYKVSSEPLYDYLSFKINGVEILKKSGEIAWTKKTVAISAGINNLEWTYKKDNTVSQGLDCAWIDLIDFAQSTPVKYIQKDLQVAKIVSPIANQEYGMETISVKVVNPGADVIDGFNLAYIVNNRLPAIMQHFDNKLMPAGDSALVSFDTQADLSRYGVYKVAAYGLENHDDYLLNDTAYIKIENVKITETVGVFPNPFVDNITIYINSPVPEKIHISLFNISGVKLYEIEKDILNGNTSITINDFKLSPALYYLNIKGASVNKTVSVIKMNK